MLSRLRNRQRGFTLIELLIVIAIIGIIAALLIPNFLDSLQKARQKRSQGDLRNVGTAWMAWLTDEYQASAAGRRTGESYVLPTGDSSSPSYLQTRYIQKLPEGDGWKNGFNYFRAANIYTQQTIMAIRSNGFKGSPETSGTVTVMGFAPTDYEQDIIWGDGFFIRWPGKNS